jgi:CubicO group peptidase (beta-lactamase class C family)
MIKSFLVISLSILLITNIFPQNISKKLDQYLEEYYINKNVPSISAGLMQDGKIIWLGVKGYSDIENNIAAEKKSVYRIASVSKMITAVAVLQLVEQNKIKLDEDVRKYIPYYPIKRWKFTVRQLLTHTAGIRNYKSSGEFESKEYFQSTKEVINYLSKDNLIYEPGTKFLYTTLSYNLLAAIIERVSGLSFADYIKTNILDPADMKSTYPDFQRNIIPNRARGYERNIYRQFQNTALADLSIKIPGGGLLSTAEDLLRFSDSLLKGKLIAVTTLDSMIVPTKLKNGKTINYGLGLSFGIDESGRKFISHSGTGTGFISMLLIYPQENVSSVHLINMRDRNLGEPAFDIAAISFRREVKNPERSLADFLLELTFNYGIDSSINAYRYLTIDTTNNFIKTKEESLAFGYDLINAFRSPDAIKYFRFLTYSFPNDAEVLIGLADAYYKDGNKGLSIRNFRLALRLKPLNKYANEMIKKLEGI